MTHIECTDTLILDDTPCIYDQTHIRTKTPTTQSTHDTLSPIRKHQRPHPLSGIFLLRPPSPWEPSTTPPSILGHHNPTKTPHDPNTHIQSTHILNDSLILYDHIHSHSTTLNLNETPTIYET